MTRISRLAYQIVADAQQFSQGIALSRNEMQLANKVFRESIDPATAYAAEVTALEQLHAKGALSAEQYAAAVQRLDETHEGAIGNTDQLAQEVQQAGQTYEETAEQIRNAAMAVTTFVGTLTAGAGLMAREAIAAYQVQEGAETRLMALMQARGTFTEQNIDQYRRFASQMQATTIYGDELVLGLIQQTEALGLSGESSERAARNALALSAALGVGTQSAIRMASQLEQGETSMLTRYIPALRAIEDPALKAAEAQEVLGNMFAAATAEADTTSGQYQQMANAIGDAQEAVGEFMAQALLPLINGVQSAAETFTALPNSLQSTIAYAGLATVGLGALATVTGGAVTIAGQAVIAYSALSKALVSVSASSRLASVGMSTMSGAGLAAAGATSVIVGYQLGHWLHDVTEHGQAAAEVMGYLQANMESISNVDLTGSTQEDLEQYITATERQIANIEQHNAEMEDAKAWWNVWQANRDLINANAEQVDALRDNLNNARIELQNLANQANPAVINQAGVEALEKVTARLHEQIAVVGLSADEAERWKLAQEGVTDEQLRSVAAMQQQVAAQQAQVNLRNDVDELVASLERQIQTAGMSAEQIQLLDLRARGLSEAWIQMIGTMQQEAAAAKQAVEAEQQAAKEQEQLRDRVDNLTASLHEQIATAGMSADEIERWRLAQAGVAPEQIEQIRLLQQQAEAARRATEERERLTGATQGSAEALQRIEAYRQLLEGTTTAAVPDVPTQPQLVQATDLVRPEDVDRFVGGPLPAGPPGRTEELLERIANAIEGNGDRIVIDEIRR